MIKPLYLRLFLCAAYVCFLTTGCASNAMPQSTQASQSPQGTLTRQEAEATLENPSPHDQVVTDVAGTPDHDSLPIITIDEALNYYNDDTKVSDTKTSDTKVSDTKASDTKVSDNTVSDNTASDNTVGDATIDVDLTILSSTMIYAEVFNIMIYPDDYVGKTIKISGPYYAAYYDETGQYYHYVIIEDALACCQSGLEFVWEGDHQYPDDYPAEQTKIEVTGIFKRYEELGQTYYCLSVDDITIY